ncbi:hypothetical protein VXQ18_06925 [Brucella abortus]|nr:hypothetical protein [Brucella abortus]
MASKLPDEPYFQSLLFGYFPKRMAKTYAEEISHHRLKREIIATLLANDAVNRGGITSCQPSRPIRRASRPPIFCVHLCCGARWL